MWWISCAFNGNMLFTFPCTIDSANRQVPSAHLVSWQLCAKSKHGRDDYRKDQRMLWQCQEWIYPICVMYTFFADYIRIRGLTVLQWFRHGSDGPYDFQLFSIDHRQMAQIQCGGQHTARGFGGLDKLQWQAAQFSWTCTLRYRQHGKDPQIRQGSERELLERHLLAHAGGRKRRDSANGREASIYHLAVTASQRYCQKGVCALSGGPYIWRWCKDIGPLFAAYSGDMASAWFRGGRHHLQTDLPELYKDHDGYSGQAQPVWMHCRFQMETGCRGRILAKGGCLGLQDPRANDPLPGRVLFRSKDLGQTGASGGHHCRMGGYNRGEWIEGRQGKCTGNHSPPAMPYSPND